MRKIFISIFLLVSIGLQSQSDFFKNPVYSISFFNHSINLPGYDQIVKKPLNFGAVIGIEFTYNQKAISSTHQKIEVGWYRHKNLNKALYVKTDFVHRFTAKSGFYTEYNVGFGGIVDIPEFQTFKVDNNGGFTTDGIGARLGALFSLGVSGGYDVEINENLTLSPFVKYESILQFPHSNTLPLFPHSMLHLGSRIKL